MILRKISNTLSSNATLNGFLTSLEISGCPSITSIKSSKISFEKIKVLLLYKIFSIKHIRDSNI